MEEWSNIIPDDDRLQANDEMVRIKCNVCKQYKTLKAKSYEKMLRQFGFERSALFGAFHGIQSVILDYSIQKILSKEETEKAFAGVYVCQDCKNNKDETMKVTRSLSKILNLKKKEDYNEPTRQD